MLEGQRVIDVHHHFLPRVVFDELKAQAGGAPRLINDKISITLSEDLHRVDSHLRAMDEGGVDAAVLTYSGVSVLGMETCRKLNDGFADIQQANPRRLYGAAHVPIQEPDAAPRELERGVRELGLVAAAIPTSAPGLLARTTGTAQPWESSRWWLAARAATQSVHPGAWRPTWWESRLEHQGSLWVIQWRTRSPRRRVTAST